MAGFLGGCGGSNGNDLATPLASTRQYKSLRLTLSMPKTRYALGEDIPFAFTITNTSLQSVTLRTTGGPIQPADPIDATLSKEGVRVWNKNDGKGGSDVVGTVTIGPGETNRYPFIWNQQGSKESGPVGPVSAGTYRIEAFPDIRYEEVTNAKMQLSVPPLTLSIN